VGLTTGYETASDSRADGTNTSHHATGDVVRIDEEGYLFFIGRIDDVFKSSDYRISPFELESAAAEHPAVLEAAVVPSPVWPGNATVLPGFSCKVCNVHVTSLLISQVSH
jgi:acetyl-CoA synthetase